MKLTAMLAAASLLSASVLVQSSAAFAATNSNDPSVTDTTKSPAMRKSMKHYKHHAKRQGKHYGRAVHHPMKHKAM